MQQDVNDLTAEDHSHLKALSICWYVYGGLTLFGGLCMGLYIVAGIGMIVGGAAENEGELALVGGIFTVVGLVTLVLTGGIGILNILAGQGLARRRRKVLIYIMSGIACLNVPLGVILAVFTFIVMARPTVGAAFGRASNQTAVTRRVEP